jgi:hypothetical protein
LFSDLLLFLGGDLETERAPCNPRLLFWVFSMKPEAKITIQRLKCIFERELLVELMSAYAKNFGHLEITFIRTLLSTLKATEADRRRGPGTREKVRSKRINLEGNTHAQEINVSQLPV